MKKLLLPIVLLLLGTGAGVGAGLVLKPAEDEMPDMAAAPCGEMPEGAAPAATASTPAADAVPPEYAKLNNQFVVPVVTDTSVAALVVMSISIEVPAGAQETVYAAEPKLRDSLLQVLFGYANAGGFSGNFTSASNMMALRTDLLAAARAVLGDVARDILILDILRQDS